MNSVVVSSNAGEKDVFSRLHFSPSANLQTIRFDSRSEAVCAILLERYVSGWICETGKTHQVKAGPKTIDFRIGDTFLEYHPIKLGHEFINADAYARLCDALRGVRREVKREILSAVKAELASQYWKRRRDALNAAGFQDCKLVVAHDADELYQRILLGCEHIPSRADFRRIFKRTLRSL